VTRICSPCFGVIGLVGAVALGCGGGEPPPRSPEEAAPPPHTLREEEKAGLTPAQIAIMSEGPTEIPALVRPPYRFVKGPAWEALLATSGPSIELYRLEPGDDPREERDFHGHRILKRRRARDLAPVIATLVSAVEHQGPSAACFAPHHGIRVRTSRVTYDFVICFSCRNIQIYASDKSSDYAATDNVSTAMNTAFARNGL
jgi:hypothetical protein